MSRTALVAVPAVVGYSLVRCLGVWGLLTGYGVNPIAFAVIDIATAVPYAMAWPRVSAAVGRRSTRSALWWLSVAFVSFAAPYAYLGLAAPGYPSGAAAALGVFIALASLSLVIGARKAIRQGMEGRQALRPRAAW